MGRVLKETLPRSVLCGFIPPAVSNAPRARLSFKLLHSQVFLRSILGAHKERVTSLFTLEDVSIGKADSQQRVVVFPHFPLFFLPHGSCPQHRSFLHCFCPLGKKPFLAQITSPRLVLGHQDPPERTHRSRCSRLISSTVRL